MRPLRATSATAPGIFPASISPRSARLTRSSRSDESPTSSGLAVGRPWAQTIPLRKTTLTSVRRAISRFIAYLP